MASPAGVLATALASKDADAAAKAYETLSDQKLDARTYAKTSDLMARSRKNQLAWDAFEAGRTHHGVPTLLKSGLNFNALLYACCREKEMLEKAMAVWELMTEHEVKPDAEPAEKLLLANLAKGKYDDAFSTFLGCVDAGIQPAQPACTALVKTSAVVPRLAQMAFAVQLTMKTAGMEMPNDLLISLQKACMSTGTADQCLALQADLDAAGAPLLQALRLLVARPALPRAAGGLHVRDGGRHRHGRRVPRGHTLRRLGAGAAAAIGGAGAQQP